MNRRHFFKSLAAVAGATSVSPLIFIPKFEPVRWKVRQPDYCVFLENPDGKMEIVQKAFAARDYFGIWRWRHEYFGAWAVSEFNPKAL